MGIQDREHLEIKSAKTFSAWLTKNHSKSDGLWVVIYKSIAETTTLAAKNIRANQWRDQRATSREKEM